MSGAHRVFSAPRMIYSCFSGPSVGGITPGMGAKGELLFPAPVSFRDMGSLRGSGQSLVLSWPWSITSCTTNQVYLIVLCHLGTSSAVLGLYFDHSF